MGSEFWNDRVSKYGHTGWNDRAIYAYDQLARLKAIETVIASLDCKREFALDFGTGTGDFANLLANHFQRVLAFDISDKVIDVANHKYVGTPNIRFVNRQSITDIATDNKLLDIILSVTVLDHIMNDDELERTIQWFHTNLSNKGYVVVLEYSLLSQRDPSAYQRFSTMDEWLKRFSNNGLPIKTSYNFYHPHESPCRSYELYMKTWTVSCLGLLNKVASLDPLNKLRLVERFARNRFVSKHLEAVARSLIANNSDFLRKGQESKSPLHVMIFRRGS